MEPYSQTWLAEKLDISYPELVKLGATLFVLVAPALLLAALVLWRRHKKMAVLILGASILAAFVAIAAITDMFCVSGYLINDGAGCAWE